MVQVHPTAVVDPKAELAEGVVIEAYAIVEAGVRIGARTQVGAHALITGLTQRLVTGLPTRFAFGLLRWLLCW
jgi:UDP-N-acetylglucosamine acyltransferase